MLLNKEERPPLFQSTLPYGSERLSAPAGGRKRAAISIHAPLRERDGAPGIIHKRQAFQSTLPYGSDNDGELFWLEDCISIHAPLRERPVSACNGGITESISIHAPLRERRIKTNYFSINLSQAFFANRLNSNTQEFYFDVRKLLVSHSSPGCEPKLNYMFHITSHRIILHYFSSCQSICK